MNAYIEYNPDIFRGKTILLPCDDPEWSNFTKFFAQNFENFGLKKLISTSYAAASKAAKYKQKVDNFHRITIFELNSPNYSEEKTDTHGKIFVLDRDSNNDKKIDINDLTYDYLDGDGDYNSKEVKALRDEADIIITNPPFSKFREFIAWIMEANKKFAVIGNMNAITYKEIFPLIKENKIWLDNPFVRGAGYFTTPMKLNKELSYFNSNDYKEGFIRVPGVRWFTNIDLGRRHQPLSLMSAKDNLKYSKHKQLKGLDDYYHYDNYDAIEIPFSDSIPSNRNTIMGVPVSFMDKYCPEQFEILGCPDYTGKYGSDDLGVSRIGEEWIRNYFGNGGKGHYTANMTSLVYYDSEGIATNTYKRVLIRYTDSWIKSHPADFKEENQ